MIAADKDDRAMKFCDMDGWTLIRLNEPQSALAGHHPVPYFSIMEPVVQRKLPLCESLAVALHVGQKHARSGATSRKPHRDLQEDICAQRKKDMAIGNCIVGGGSDACRG